MANAPVPGTPKSSGAPKRAPSQTIIVTGKGPNEKALDGHPAQPALAPQPASAATTGPKGSQSVDYNKNQGSRVTAAKGGPGLDVGSEQQQQKKRT